MLEKIRQKKTPRKTMRKTMKKILHGRPILSCSAERGCALVSKFSYNWRLRRQIESGAAMRRAPNCCIKRQNGRASQRTHLPGPIHEGAASSERIAKNAPRHPQIELPTSLYRRHAAGHSSQSIFVTSIQRGKFRNTYVRPQFLFLFFFQIFFIFQFFRFPSFFLFFLFTFIFYFQKMFVL